MSEREPLFSDELVLDLAERLPTPFHIYSEAGMRQTAQGLNQAFDWVRMPDGSNGYRNHVAVKALPHPWPLDVLHQEGMGADASSGPEIQLARAVGMQGDEIMFTSNDTDPAEYVEAHEAGAIINLDDIFQIDVLRGALKGEFPDTICFRIDLGDLKQDGVSDIIGKPGDSKFGVPEEQVEEAYRRAKELGVEHFGMHTMVVSNELDAQKHVETAELLFARIAEISQELGITFEFVNLGGGLGIPYRPEEEPVDYDQLRTGIQKAYDEHIVGNGLSPLRILTENGRHVTGPNGITVFHARSLKETHHRHVGLDGSTNAHAPRPPLYDAYHRVIVPGKTGPLVVQRVTGGLCEDNDYVFGSATKERELPLIEPGDVVAALDTGAHWAAMANNYNGKLRAAEYMLWEDGNVSEISRAETRRDLFARIIYPGLAAELDRQR